MPKSYSRKVDTPNLISHLQHAYKDYHFITCVKYVNKNILKLEIEKKDLDSSEMFLLSQLQTIHCSSLTPGLPTAYYFQFIKNKQTLYLNKHNII